MMEINQGFGERLLALESDFSDRANSLQSTITGSSEMLNQRTEALQATLQARHADLGWDAVVGTVRVADWSGYRAGVRSLFRDRYGAASGPHPHVHGANLGFRASAYLRAGGFPEVPTAEDHALVAALTASGARVRRIRALAVTTSARREARAPHGFSHYLAELEADIA